MIDMMPELPAKAHKTRPTNWSRPEEATTWSEAVERTRDQIRDNQGYFALACGCLIRLDPKALANLSPNTIIEATLQAAGTCRHTLPH
jgi:hypothetical protein